MITAILYRDLSTGIQKMDYSSNESLTVGGFFARESLEGKVGK